MQQAGRRCRLAQRIAHIPHSSLAQNSSCRLPAGPLGFQGLPSPSPKQAAPELDKCLTPSPACDQSKRLAWG